MGFGIGIGGALNSLGWLVGGEVWVGVWLGVGYRGIGACRAL
jgi:hypothetical protein